MGRRPQPERRRRRAVGSVRRGAGQCAWPRGQRVVGGIRPRREDSSSDLEVRNPFPATSLSPSAVACDLLSGPGVGASWWPARGPGETLAGPAGPAAATPKGAAFLHGGAAEVPCFHPDPPCPGENLISSRIWRRRRLARRDLAGGAVREAGCGREALQVRDGAASSSSSDSTKRIST